jgi:hypothetical protein
MAVAFQVFYRSLFGIPEVEPFNGGNKVLPTAILIRYIGLSDQHLDMEIMFTDRIQQLSNNNAKCRSASGDDATSEMF